ncbi:hypothetical protein [Patulibacter minatonensis]|uniref:hypothetical protein n=1 Tax=Patulibacter minatonensis TaxID=298163 RepID=UPI0012FA84E5|nr:hypothetical protein [Patulibacter minatonensis]
MIGAPGPRDDRQDVEDDDLTIVARLKDELVDALDTVDRALKAPATDAPPGDAPPPEDE